MHKNYTVVSDRVAPAREDEVMVEGRGELPHVAPVSALAPAPASPAGERVVVVQPGDTLSGIARRSGTTVSALCAANHISASSPIRAGQKLRVPGATGPVPRPAASPASRPAVGSYTIKRGDTLSGIAARHGVSTAALMRANNLTPQQADRIREGQRLRIPAAR